MHAGPRSSWLARAAQAMPNRCAVCHADSRGAAGRVCADCRHRYASAVPRCRHCALPVPGGITVCGACLRAPPPWSAAWAACDYGYPWDGLLAAFKFHAALDLAPALAQLLVVALQAPAVPAVDVLLPVPLADARLRERGYNQALLLAHAVRRQLALRCEPDWLLRIADTPHQLAQPRERRIANVHGAFAVEPRALPALRGLRVALLDDVLTTGATAAEITRVLLAAGAASVQVWVVARTPND